MTKKILYKLMVMHMILLIKIYLYYIPKDYLVQKSSRSSIVKPAKPFPASTQHLLKSIEEDVCNVKRGLGWGKPSLKPPRH